jgi:HEPN domain-containing protein
MSDEARRWLGYAQENREVAAMTLDSGHYNACLHNAQQAVEKALKAICLLKDMPLKKTHSISELAADVRMAGVKPPLNDDDCELLDAIYLPSKYPLGSALPDFEPDHAIAKRCLDLADRVVDAAAQVLTSAQRAADASDP